MYFKGSRLWIATIFLSDKLSDGLRPLDFLLWIATIFLSDKLQAFLPKIILTVVDCNDFLI